MQVLCDSCRIVKRKAYLLTLTQFEKKQSLYDILKQKESEGLKLENLLQAKDGLIIL